MNSLKGATSTVLRCLRLRILAVLLLGAGLPVQAVPARDSVLLDNGKRISGEITGMDEKYIQMIVDGMEIGVGRQNVERIFWEGDRPRFPLGKETPVREKPSGESDAIGDLPPLPTPRPIFSPTPTDPPPALSGVMGGATSDSEVPETPGSEVKDTPVPPMPEALPEVAFPYPGKEPLIPLALPAGRFRIAEGVRVRLREGPSGNYPEVGRVSSPDALIELDEQDGWYYVLTEDGSRGWILGTLTREVKTQPCLVNGLRLNMRRGAGTDSEILKQYNPGDVLIELEKKGEWSRVRDLKGTYGWVASAYVDPVTDIRMIRRPVIAMSPARSEEYLRGAASVRWTPAGQGKVHLRLDVFDDDLLRNGEVVLLGLRNTPRSATEEVRDLFQGDSLSWQQRFRVEKDLEDLGLSLALLQTVDEATVIYLRGESIERGWRFEVDANLQDLRKNQLGIVVQKGIERGAFAELPQPSS